MRKLVPNPKSGSVGGMVSRTMVGLLMGLAAAPVVLAQSAAHVRSSATSQSQFAEARGHAGRNSYNEAQQRKQAFDQQREIDRQRRKAQALSREEETPSEAVPAAPSVNSKEAVET